MEQRWITPIVITASVVIGAAAYLYKPMISHSASRQAQAPSATAESQEGISQSPIARCVGPVDLRISRSSLNEKYRWAHTLVEQKLYDAALPDLRYVATADPGFPGINLDVSDALLQLKQPEEATAAINSQLATSECLAKLSPEDVDAYCKSELPQSTTEGCRSQLAYIGRAAQLQAALVHLELGHQTSPQTTASTADAPIPAVPHSPRAASAPRRTSTGNAERVHKSSSADRGLMDGEGTDSALGYSKQ